EAVALDQTSSQIVDKVLELYDRYTGPQLVTMSHTSGGPWDKAWKANADEIQDESIEKYFKSLIKH
ncbi:hypothetical protein, partial [Agrobacterium pusense]